MSCGITSVRKPSRPRLIPSSGTLMTGHHPRAVEQGAVAADGDQEVRLAGDFFLGQARDAVEPVRDVGAVADEHLDAAGFQVRQQDAHGLRDARIHKPADQGALAHRKSHGTPRSF